MDEQPVRKPAYWAILPAEIRYNPEITPMAKILYAEISALSNEYGYCFATNEYFLKLYGITERTLQDHLKALKVKGFIKIENGNGGASRRRIYSGINPLTANPAENCGGTPQKIAGGGAENCGDNKKDNKKPNKSPQTPKGAKGENWDFEMFERFWNKYPRKQAKVDALKAWNKLKPDRKLMRKMSDAIDAQLKTEQWKRDNGRHIPLPATWINGRRWEDELTVSVPAAKPAEEVQREWI